MRTTLSIMTAALMSCAGSLGLEAKTESFTDTQKKEIQTIISDTLKENPSIVEDSLKKAFELREQNERSQQQQKISMHSDAIFNSSDDPTSGNPNGSITLVVFDDPYCGYCRRFKGVIDEVVSKNKDIRVVYKIIPILGKASDAAARESLAANKAGSSEFTKFRDALYGSDISKVRDRKARFDVAQKNGADTTAIKKQINKSDAAIERAIKRNVKLFEILGGSGTPTFVVGSSQKKAGTLIAGFVDADNLTTIIEAVKTDLKIS